jgi:hypothetical protein
MDTAAWSQKIGLVLRITDQAVQTWPLNEWALLRRVLPDGGSSDPEPGRFMPDKGSSLAFDDLAFMPELGDHVVSATARFPVMMATENLVGAAQVHGAAFQQRRTNIASVASLCRCAIEASAKTIWLLAGTTREERRARCLGYTQSERQPQEGFIRIEEQVFAKRKVPPDAPQYKNFVRHRAEHDDQQKLVAAMPTTQRKKPPSNSTDIVAWSAKWIDANPPVHAADQLGLGMELGAGRFYSYASSFVHAHKWMNDYIRDDIASLRTVADGFATALIMTESAVALFEAQSTHPARRAARRRNYPQCLVPTVDAWALRYE